MKSYCVSIAKPNQGQVNEDAAIARENLIAVSDGAGGGGIYADLWSRYMLQNLNYAPIRGFSDFNAWTNDIWESFYNECESMAKLKGGMVLQKFYDEGSLATIAAIWNDGDKCQWISYGDSVVFHYNPKADILEHSFAELKDFNNPPYLVNCKDEPVEQGFRSGTFNTDKDSIVFCATDALSHYIMMMYQIGHLDIYSKELEDSIRCQTKNSVIERNALERKVNFKKDVISKLIGCKGNKANFRRWIQSLLRQNLLALDDYSYAIKIF